jgi:hypothetical protein
MSFDQFDQDETLTLRYTDENGRKTTGINIAERDERNIYALILQRDSINRIADSATRAAALQRLLGPRNGARRQSRLSRPRPRPLGAAQSF